LEKVDRCPVSNRKRDIEGFVESVAEEVASFGSDVTIIEPGGARIAKLMLIDTQIPADSFLRMVDPKNGLAPGDPDQMAARIKQEGQRGTRAVAAGSRLTGVGRYPDDPLANTMPVRTTDRTRRFDGLSAQHDLYGASYPRRNLSQQIIQ
jgi:NAD(P)-dependent dehydrogenase (short-subunit alcohol dehydrogenase family)